MGIIWSNTTTTNAPRSNADIRLDTHDPLLVEESMRLSDDLVDSVPGTFCRIGRQN